MNKSEIDQAVVNPDTYTEESRVREIFSELRRADPVHWTEPDGYRPFWTITRHADITEVGKHSEIYINQPNTFVLSDEEVRISMAETGGKTQYSRMLVHMDGQDHRSHRAIAQAWFMPASLKRIEAAVETRAVELIDKMETMGGSCEFMMDIAAWFPLRVIMTLLGVPEEDHGHLLTLTQQLLAPGDPSLKRDNGGVEAFKGPVVKEFMEYFGTLYEDRKKNPQDDLASLLASAQIDGKPVGRHEVLSYYLILSTAGHDTTAASLAGGLLALIENPLEMALLRAEPALLNSGVDEMFRWVTPVKHFMRTAVAESELGGKRIAIGDKLLLSYPSANQDETAFNQPREFRINRSPNRHVAFGFGAHACLGQSLARMELRTFFKHLLARFDHFELAGMPDYIRTNTVSGLKTFPLRYSRKQS